MTSGPTIVILLTAEPAGGYKAKVMTDIVGSGPVSAHLEAVAEIVERIPAMVRLIEELAQVRA